MNQRGDVQVKVVLIRHGESEANFENYWTGWLDVALTAKGREQAWQAGEKIKELFSLPVDYQDERLTTVQAERMLVEQANTSRAKRKKVIDKLAAVMILQNYLDGSGKKWF